MAGLLDEIRLNVVPVLFGGGVRLLDTYGGPHFDLEPTLVVKSGDVTHLCYWVSK